MAAHRVEVTLHPTAMAMVTTVATTEMSAAVATATSATSTIGETTTTHY
jgi:hypothetical protein